MGGGGRGHKSDEALIRKLLISGIVKQLSYVEQNSVPQSSSQSVLLLLLIMDISQVLLSPLGVYNINYDMANNVMIPEVGRGRCQCVVECLLERLPAVA